MPLGDSADFGVLGRATLRWQALVWKSALQGSFPCLAGRYPVDDEGNLVSPYRRAFAIGDHDAPRVLVETVCDAGLRADRIEKMSWEYPFLAYGVVNDKGTPGERSANGS